MRFRSNVYLGVMLVLLVALSACGAVAPTEEPTAIPPGSQPPTAEPTQAPVEPTASPTAEPGSNELAGTSWTLAQMNGSAPIQGTTVTLVFDDATLGGTACNSYGGDYTASAGTIEVGQIASTMMACMDPAGMMDQETAYLNLLGSVTTYQLTTDHLTLGTADNPAALVFASGSGDVTAPPQGWATYQNEDAGFEISYPDTGMAPNSNPPTVGDEHSVRIDLPFAEGTNLREKYLQIDFPPTPADVCASPFTEGYDPAMLQQDTVTLNNVAWSRASGGDAGAGNFYEFTAYTLSEGGRCISLTFVLHSLNAGNFPTPPPEFDRDAETAVYVEMVSTFRWLP